MRTIGGIQAEELDDELYEFADLSSPLFILFSLIFYSHFESGLKSLILMFSVIVVG
jgi:hypothetical protein